MARAILSQFVGRALRYSFAVLYTIDTGGSVQVWLRDDDAEPVLLKTLSKRTPLGLVASASGSATNQVFSDEDTVGYLYMPRDSSKSIDDPQNIELNPSSQTSQSVQFSVNASGVSGRISSSLFGGARLLNLPDSTSRSGYAPFRDDNDLTLFILNSTTVTGLTVAINASMNFIDVSNVLSVQNFRKFTDGRLLVSLYSESFFSETPIAAPFPWFGKLDYDLTGTLQALTYPSLPTLIAEDGVTPDYRSGIVNTFNTDENGNTYDVSIPLGLNALIGEDVSVTVDENGVNSTSATIPAITASAEDVLAVIACRV